MLPTVKRKPTHWFLEMRSPLIVEGSARHYEQQTNIADWGCEAATTSLHASASPR